MRLLECCIDERPGVGSRFSPKDDEKDELGAEESLKWGLITKLVGYFEAEFTDSRESCLCKILAWAPNTNERYENKRYVLTASWRITLLLQDSFKKV